MGPSQFLCPCHQHRRAKKDAYWIWTLTTFFFFLGGFPGWKTWVWWSVPKIQQEESHTLSGIKISTLREYLQDLHPMKRVSRDLPLLSALRGHA